MNNKANTDTLARMARNDGAVGLWAVLGLITIALFCKATLPWVFSDAFSPAPIIGPDVFAPARLLALRSVEAISVIVLLVCLYAFNVRPWLKERRIPLAGKLVIGELFVGLLWDGIMNQHEYLFAWNQHSLNMGSFAQFMPWYTGNCCGTYAQALAWGYPMYVYFVPGFAFLAIVLIRQLSKRFPGLSKSTALGISFVVCAALAMVCEVGIIYSTHAYAYAKTFGPLTLFAGEVYQYPVYEGLFCGALGMCATALWLSSLENAEGVSFVERGYERYPRALQTPVRVLAVTGVASAMSFLLYYVPLNMFGLIGSSIADLPSYLRVLDPGY